MAVWCVRLLGRGLHMRARHLLTERWTGTGHVVASAVSTTASRRHPMSIDTDLDPKVSHVTSRIEWAALPRTSTLSRP